jgi:hypothetical protein
LYLCTPYTNETTIWNFDHETSPLPAALAAGEWGDAAKYKTFFYICIRSFSSPRRQFVQRTSIARQESSKKTLSSSLSSSFGIIEEQSSLQGDDNDDDDHDNNDFDKRLNRRRHLRRHLTKIVHRGGIGLFLASQKF